MEYQKRRSHYHRLQIKNEYLHNIPEGLSHFHGRENLNIIDYQKEINIIDFINIQKESFECHGIMVKERKQKHKNKTKKKPYNTEYMLQMKHKKKNMNK